CKSIRAEHSPSTKRRLDRLLSSLDLDQTIDVIRAFSVYFQLVNIAEQHHRIRRKRYYELHTPDAPQRGSIAAAPRDLSAPGVVLGDGAAPVRFGSWIGGDRDGNPNVTPEITWEAVRLQQRLVLRKYLAAVADLGRRLSHSSRFAPPTPELVASLERDAAS